MATIQSQLVCDSSTYANFSQWASAISAAFASFGWAQSNDTGQVMWTGMSISAVSMSGSNATYTYSGLTGLALAVGRALTITGMASGVNNGTFVITALGAGTFTVVNASGVTASAQSGAVTAQTTVPGSNVYVYEIWTPNDGLTNFYVKVEYGNSGGANAPSIRLTLSTSTNGAGTATGLSFGPQSTNFSGITPASTTTQYECNLSGALGRIGVMMWRNGANNCQQFFAIERSVNSSGTYTGSYVTLFTGGQATTFNATFAQRTLVFGVGPTPVMSSTTNQIGQSGLFLRMLPQPTSSSTAFNGSIPFDTAAPTPGYFDYSCTVVGVAAGVDVVEGLIFNTTLYGSTRTYLPAKIGPFAYASPTNSSSIGCLCMRFD